MARAVLVVGGTGYVGRELCGQLVAAGEEVATLTRSKPLDLPSEVEWIQADMTDTEAVRKALDGLRFDIIHHVASLPGDTGDPLQMVSVNLVGLTNLLEFARETKPERFVLSSSISACEWYPGTKFKKPDYLPVDENHPTRPRDMYCSTKRMQEILADTFYHQYGLPTTSLRLTAVVGPHGRGGGRGWREFAEMLAKGESVQIPHFSLEEVCHYVDYRDVAGLHQAAGDHPKAVGEVFNCCGPAKTSGREFEEIVQRHFPGIKVETGFPWSMAQGDTIYFSMQKAKDLIGFEPKYSLEDSILAIKEWIDSGGLAAAAAADESFADGVGEK